MQTSLSFSTTKRFHVVTFFCHGAATGRDYNEPSPDAATVRCRTKNPNRKVCMQSAPVSASIEVENPQSLIALSAPHSQVLAALAKESGAQVNIRGNTILLSGDDSDVTVAGRFLHDALKLMSSGVQLGAGDVARSLRSLREDPEGSLTSLLDETVAIATRKKPIVPKGP